MIIQIHSVTDLITNSSTVIFTYSENSLNSLKEMINEIFKTFGIDKTCDDVFNLVVLCDEHYYYQQYLDEIAENGDEVPEVSDLNQLIIDVQEGKVEKPEWFNKVEKMEYCCDYFTPDTTLHISPKLPEYQKMAELIYEFLYSTDHEACREG